MGFRQIFGGSTAPKYLTDGVPSKIWGLYTPKIFDGWGSVKYLGAVHPPNISRNHISEIFWGCRRRKYFTDGVASNIWGLYTPKIFDGWGSVKYLGVHSPQIFHGWGSVIHMGGLIKKRHMINRHGSKTEKETCKCAGNYGPPFDQCRDTLSVAPHKETAYDQLSCFKNGQRNLQMWGQLRSTMTPP